MHIYNPCMVERERERERGGGECGTRIEPPNWPYIVDGLLKSLAVDAAELEVSKEVEGAPSQTGWRPVLVPYSLV